MPPVLRHGLFYALIYIGTGMSMPYAPVWFRSVGLTAPEIGVILAAPMLGRVLAGPLVAILADRFRLRRTPLIGLSVITAVTYAALLVVKGFWFWMIGWFLAATAISAISPLADVLTLIRSRSSGFAFTHARSVGSIAYVIGNVSGGLVLAATHPAAAIVWASAAAAACALGGRVLLPAEPVHHDAPPSSQSPFSALTDLIRDRPLMLCLLTISLIQGSHALYYGFSAIAWTAHGIPTGYVGLLWGTSVLAEVTFFWVGERYRTRIGPERLILIGAVGAVVRWTALAASPPLWLLFPLQCLHALTFTSTYVGGVDLVERLSPPAHASAAQTLSASLSYGLATGAATVACGWLYAHFQTGAYLVMTVIAATGLALVAPLMAEVRRHGAKAAGSALSDGSR